MGCENVYTKRKCENGIITRAAGATSEAGRQLRLEWSFRVSTSIIFPSTKTSSSHGLVSWSVHRSCKAYVSPPSPVLSLCLCVCLVSRQIRYVTLHKSKHDDESIIIMQCTVFHSNMRISVYRFVCK